MNAIPAKTAIYIATTDGPVRVLRIVEARHLRLNTACLNLKTSKASISDDYHDFVSADVGLIAKQTGREKYRLDLSNDIDHGHSWQLGVYIAHYYHHNQSLAETDEKNSHNLDGVERIIVATGEVNIDSCVNEVSSVPRKLTRAAHLFQAAQESGVGITVLLPRDNASERVETQLKDLQQNYQQFNWHALDRISFDESSWLAPQTTLTATAAIGNEKQQEKASPAKRPRLISYEFAACLVLVGLGFGYYLLQQDSSATTPTNGDSPPLFSSVEIEAEFEWQLSEAEQCFGSERRLVTETVTLQSSETIAVDNRACALKVQFNNDSGQDLVLKIDSGDDVLLQQQLSSGPSRFFSVNLHLNRDVRERELFIEFTTVKNFSTE